MLRNAQMMSAIVDTKTNTSLFLSVVLALAESKNLIKDSITLQLTLRNAKKLVSAEYVLLYLIDFEEQDDELYVLESDMPEMKSMRIPSDEGIPGAAMAGEVQNLPDVKKDPRYDDTMDREMGYHTRNILAIPLRSKPGGEPFGVLELRNKFNRTYTGPKKTTAGHPMTPRAPPPRLPTTSGTTPTKVKQGGRPHGMEVNRIASEFDDADVKKMTTFSLLLGAYMVNLLPEKYRATVKDARATQEGLCENQDNTWKEDESPDDAVEETE